MPFPGFSKDCRSSRLAWPKSSISAPVWSPQSMAPKAIARMSVVEGMAAGVAGAEVVQSAEQVGELGHGGVTSTSIHATPRGVGRYHTEHRNFPYAIALPSGWGVFCGAAAAFRVGGWGLGAMAGRPEQFVKSPGEFLAELQPGQDVIFRVSILVEVGAQAAGQRGRSW